MLSEPGSSTPDQRLILFLRAEILGFFARFFLGFFKFITMNFTVIS